MYVVALKNQETKGAYAVVTESGDTVVQVFEDYDDAQRYLVLLEAEDFPPLVVNEVDEDYIVNMCERNNFKFVIISKDDIVIPRCNF